MTRFELLVTIWIWLITIAIISGTYTDYKMTEFHTHVLAIVRSYNEIHAEQSKINELLSGKEVDHGILEAFQSGQVRGLNADTGESTDARGGR